ncbi:hypothetical protein BAMA_15255 [Bacillus manliponensis]|uniref:Uncharacterized protein n=1 Tax=Bacillus manliponensis TaxID=574376 RepID=A0A073K544_9BACI|nr:hypothetical protein [Bacillus manliponensis]KEK17383.1 hypothetical protein BAMA_15255 [Bacillus manliponensis]
MKNELVEVKIGYGKGIGFVIPLLVDKNCTDEKIKTVAIKCFKEYMPTHEEVQSVETYLQDRQAYLLINRIREKRYSRAHVKVRGKVEMFECPDCGFEFNAVHQTDDEQGGYECPLCELDRVKKS